MNIVKNSLKKVFLSSLVVSNLAYAESCWDVMERSELAMSSLDGIITFSFKDAKSCEPISYANVRFLGKNLQTDESGYLRIPVPPNNLDLEVPLTVSKNGYMTLKQKVMASVGSYWQNKFLMAKYIPIDKAMFVLSWGENPKDLDLHLKGSNFHISYRNRNGGSYASLDRDAMNGHGPETITLNRLDSSQNYKLLVYNYSGGGMDEKVNISVYTNAKINKVVNLNSSLGRCVEVANIHDNKVHYTMKTVPNSNCR